MKVKVKLKVEVEVEVEVKVKMKVKVKLVVTRTSKMNGKLMIQLKKKETKILIQSVYIKNTKIFQKLKNNANILKKV